MALRELDEPEHMIATLAHEIAHIKLLGENRMEENDEIMTDLKTLFFGLGVFNANAALLKQGENFIAANEDIIFQQEI